jgi:type VI secretion system protein ImpK
MQEESANPVFAVIDHALYVKEGLDRGDAPVLSAEQATLKQLLSDESEFKRYTDISIELDIRYALVCWLDELFILSPAWGGQWNEQKLEVELFGTNDRAWKFWEKARRALTRADSDVLEVYYLCVMLGFRGELYDDPGALYAWTAAARSQVERNQVQAWVPPPELEPPSHVPPLHGRERFGRMVLRGGVALLILIPCAVLFLAQQLRR